ncbi:virulence factor TspB C-terminal domain-related protein, partial [Ectopseudomonas hydrolytica]
ATAVVPCEFRTSTDACGALYQKVGANTSYGFGALQHGYCYYYRPPGEGTAVEGVWKRQQLNGQQLPPIPVTDPDLDNFVSNFNDPGQVVPDVVPTILDIDPSLLGPPDGVVFTGPSSMPGQPTHTTTLDNVSGNTTVIESTPTHHFQYDTNPLSVTSHTTTVTNTYVNGQQTSSTTTSNQSQNPVTSPTPVETPTDCAFMPTVCAFIEWVKTPFTEQSPDFGDFIENEDFERDFNIPGNSTCPAPMIISTSKGGYEFSWEPACQWAGLIKPFIIIGALILAIMINLGSFRRD